MKKIVFILLLLSFGLGSCKKTENTVGREIIPEGDLLGATYCDTLTVLAYSALDDSLRTDESYIGNIPQLIGSIADPVFGTTHASVFFNLTNPNNVTNIGFGSAPKLDSVVLTLAYQRDNYYGDKSDPLLFNVYRLTQSIYYDSAYYSYSKADYNPNADITFSGNGKQLLINSSTEVVEGGQNFAPHIRIRLKDEIGLEFMNDTTKLASTSTLLENFKGICVTTKNTSLPGNDFGCIAYIDFTSPLSKISIYYHNNADTLNQKRLDLTVRTNSAKFNQYDHDYNHASTEFRDQLPPVNNKNLGNQTVFLQGMAGSKVIVEIPYLNQLSKNGKIAVNKADLVFSVNEDAAYFDASKYFVPTRTMLEGINATGETYALNLDRSYDFTGKWGYFDATTKQYSFPLPYTTQRIANRLESSSFSLRIFQNHSIPSRVVLKGKNNVESPLKLKLWYTKVE